MSTTPDSTPRPANWDALHREVDHRFNALIADTDKVKSELLQAIEEEKQNDILLAIRNLSTKVDGLGTRLTAIEEKIEDD